MKRKNWFKPKAFTHFAPKIMAEKAPSVKAYAQNPSNIACHRFYPLIHRTIVTRRLKLGKNQKGHPIKKHYTYKADKKESTSKYREIYYPSHLDAHIYSYYTHEILEPLYEAILREGKRLNESIIGYRRIPLPDGSRCKANFDFANDVFEFIRHSKGEIAVLCLDVSKFFDSLDHKLLKQSWVKLLDKEAHDLPQDHYNIYKSLTRFSFVELKSLLKLLNIKHPNRVIEKNVAHFAETGKEFREKIKNSGLIKQNPFRKEKSDKSKAWVGIPQGTPISPFLANLYLLEFDKMVLSMLPLESLYRRYSDDILIICPKEIYASVEDEIYKLIDVKFRLTIQPGKTQRTFFIDGRLERGQKPISYLGFQFDGCRKLLRPASIAKFYRKLKRNVRFRAYRAKCAKRKHRRGRKVDRTLHRKRLYQQFSYIGSNRKNGKDRNFFSYVYFAAKVMDSPHMKNQLSKAWSILHSEIIKYENRFRLPTISRVNTIKKIAKVA
jgi:hypothetical protein